MCTVHTLVDSIDTSIHCCKSQHSIFLYVNEVPVYFTAYLVDLHFMLHIILSICMKFIYIILQKQNCGSCAGYSGNCHK